jgi:hypothetical protein
VSNGTNAAFTALKYDVDTAALKTFINNSMGKTTTAGSLITVTNGSGAALKDNTVAVDTTALKAFITRNKNQTVITTAAITYTIPDTADVVIFNGTAPTTFTLPSASTNTGRELKILNYAKTSGNTVLTLSGSIITEGDVADYTDTRINSKSSTYSFPAGIGSQVMNTITIISNGTSWYKLGN